MEKFLWNVVGVILFCATILSVEFVVFSDSGFLYVLCAIFIILDLIYINKRPEWLEV